MGRTDHSETVFEERGRVTKCVLCISKKLGIKVSSFLMKNSFCRKAWVKFKKNFFFKSVGECEESQLTVN